MEEQRRATEACLLIDHGRAAQSNWTVIWRRSGICGRNSATTHWTCGFYFFGNGKVYMSAMAQKVECLNVSRRCCSNWQQLEPEASDVEQKAAVLKATFIYCTLSFTQTLSSRAYYVFAVDDTSHLAHCYSLLNCLALRPQIGPLINQYLIPESIGARAEDKNNTWYLRVSELGLKIKTIPDTWEYRS